MVREESNMIGENIRRARRAAGLSQQAMAVQLGMAVGSVYRWERGIAVPPVPTLRRVAEALGTTLAALVDEGKP